MSLFIFSLIILSILKTHEVNSFSTATYSRRNIINTNTFLCTETVEKIQDINDINNNEILNKIPIDLLNNKIIEDTIEDNNIDDEDDPYNELFNLDRLLDTEENQKTLSANTIVIDPSANNKDVSFIKPNKKSKWDEWNNFMLGDLNSSIKENELFITEMKNIVEQNRGIAIWSSKTDEEIQKEKKKSLASKGLVIPSYVSMIVNAVYLEKICTLKEMKKEEEYAFGQYRKWIREQRKRLKKDPLPIIKTELLKKWLFRDPNSFFSTTFNSKSARYVTGLSIHLRRPPIAVFDEITNEFKPIQPKSSNITSTTFSNIKKSLKPSISSSGIKISSTAISPLLTPSIVNWEKSAMELIDSPTNPSSITTLPDKVNQNIILNSYETFKIDNTSMYIANNCVDGYYVVL